MNPVEKALWYIEAHVQQDMSLPDIAASAGVSRHHLLRAFGAATGLSVMRYVRGRRLTESAHRLANGAGDILTVAMEAGYNSHEAFTRAFGDQFGCTPVAVRAQRHVQNLRLITPLSFEAPPLQIERPRIEVIDVLLIAGVGRRYQGLEDSAGVPGQWEQFGSDQARVQDRMGAKAYGACLNLDDDGSMDYLCGVPVARFSSQPREFTCLRIPQRKYAVFFHREHIASIRRTWDAIWNGWLPESGHEVADAPLLERYDDHQQPQAGHGGFALLVPLN